MSEPEEERTLTRLRSLWKSLLARNERSLFVEKKLCRSRMVHFLAGHLGGATCEAVRLLALDLLSGCVPRLGDKTDALIRPLVPPLLTTLTEAPKEISTKAFHVLRAYSRATTDIDSFIEDFCRLGLQSNSEETQLSCIHGMCIVFDQDIGDKLYSILLPSLSSLLKRNGPPKVLRSSYRSLRRIHDLIDDDDRFLKWMDPEAAHLYSTFLEFDEEDLYLNSELLEFPNLISEYQKKMARIHLSKAFGIVDPDYLMPIGDIRDSQRAMAVSKLATTLKRAPWNEKEVESHILDLIKLVAAFLADDSNRLVKTCGLEILKEVISRMGFRLGQHLTNLVDILRETLVTSSCVEVISKTKKVVHRLMRVVHPMSVVWEMFREWEPKHKEAILGLICGEIKCFPYCDFDLVGLCATVGQEMEDSNPGIRQWSRECVMQLLNVMQASPVPVMKQQAVDVLLGMSSLKRETLRSLGILEAESRGFELSSNSEESASSCTAPSTAMSSTSTLVSELSTVRSNPRSRDTSQLGPNTKPDTAQSTISKYSRPNMTLQERPTVLSSSSDLQSHSLNSFQVREDAAPYTAESTCDEIFNLKFGNKSSSPGKHAKNSLPSIKNSKGSTIPKTPRNQHLPNIRHSNIPVSTGGFASKIVISSRLYPESSSAPVTMLNFTSEEYAHIENVLGKKPQDISQHLKLKDLQHGEPISMCSIIYSDQMSEKRDSPFSVPDCCSLIGPPLDTSTPQIRTNFLNDTNLISSERRMNFSGGDTKQVTTMNGSFLESWLHRYGIGIPLEESNKANEAKCTDDRCDIQEEPLLAEGNCTLISISSVNTERDVNENSQSASICQVQNLDPDKYNFNIMSVSVPDLTQNVRELNDSFGNESLVEISPTLITTPGESDASPFPSTNRLPKSTYAQKKQLAHNMTEKFSREKPSIKTDTQIITESDKNPNKYRRSSDPDTYKKTQVISDQRGSMKKKKISTQVSKFKDPTPKILSSPSSDKYSFDPVYYKPTYSSAGNTLDGVKASTDDREDTGEDTVLDTSIGTDDGRQQKISDTKTTKKEGLVKRMDSKRGSSSSTIARRTEKRSLDKSGSKVWSSSSVESPTFYKGKGLPRTPVVVSEDKRVVNRLKVSKIARVKADGTKKTVAVEKKENALKVQKKRSCIPKQKEEEVKVSEDDPIKEDMDDPPLPLLVDEHLNKCPWRRDVEYAQKGGTCPWALSFEECYRQVEPLPSEESAETELKKALEHLDTTSWKSKEESLASLLRVAVHHPEVASREISRTVVAVCREVRNFRQSVAGKAVIALGLLYTTMGRRMEGKLRVVIGSLVTKSGNRTLAAYFRLVIQSLFRIVSSSSPQKVALAFINEGSRHPNKASRETAAQFLALLAETMGSGNSLSGPLTSQMLKCAAHFVFDCSPLTRYCGKRMFQVFVKHPQFDKLKDHHLEIGTSKNLSKVLEHIKSKGVSEEVLPINIIKEKTENYPSHIEN